MADEDRTAREDATLDRLIRALARHEKAARELDEAKARTETEAALSDCYIETDKCNDAEEELREALREAFSEIALGVLRDRGLVERAAEDE